MRRTSLYALPAKIPDLIGIKERKYLDHTATHLHRGIGDLMRYAAQVTFALMTDFGPYHMLSPKTRSVQGALVRRSALRARSIPLFVDASSQSESFQRDAPIAP